MSATVNAAVAAASAAAPAGKALSPMTMAAVIGRDELVAVVGE